MVINIPEHLMQRKSDVQSAQDMVDMFRGQWKMEVDNQYVRLSVLRVDDANTGMFSFSLLNLFESTRFFCYSWISLL